MDSLILASRSPRRCELLTRMGISFETDAADVDESSALPAPDTVCLLSRRKAAAVASRHPGRFILGADTLVAVDGQSLGKPADEADAARMLKALSGRDHRVFTGVTVARGGRVLSDYEETAVHFRPLTEREIAAYIATGEPMDKAGAYGIQGCASLFVRGIEGDYFNVVGLPLCRLGEMLKQLGIELI